MRAMLAPDIPDDYPGEVCRGMDAKRFDCRTEPCFEVSQGDWLDLVCGRHLPNLLSESLASIGAELSVRRFDRASSRKQFGQSEGVA